MGRHAARRDGARRARVRRALRAEREAQRRAGDAARVVGARQHAGDLPQVVRPSHRRSRATSTRARRSRCRRAPARGVDRGRAHSPEERALIAFLDRHFPGAAAASPRRRGVPPRERSNPTFGRWTSFKPFAGRTTERACASSISGSFPTREVYRDLRTVDEVCDAIVTLAVRGAPAIGIAGAMGMSLASTAPTTDRNAVLLRAAHAHGRIRSARPTAVNLGWAVDRDARRRRFGAGRETRRAR